ncbi:MAG: Npun_F0494 family protein [Nostocales cyanobacterium ELA608]
MSAVDFPNLKPLVYTKEALKRAERSLICSPFHLNLFMAMTSQSIPLGVIAMDKGVKQNYTNRPLSELSCENALAWLIDVGVLRREVDGQGITDSFRLTPLGYQLIGKLKDHNYPSATLSDRLNDFITRWLRLPF